MAWHDGYLTGTTWFILLRNDAASKRPLKNDVPKEGGGNPFLDDVIKEWPLIYVINFQL